MTERIKRTLAVCRDRLLRDGSCATSFGVVSAGHPLLAAGQALDAVLQQAEREDWNAEASRLAAHRAMGALEVVATRFEQFREHEAYQALLEIAYS